MTAWLLDALHIVAFGLGIGAVWARGHALRGVPHVSDLRRAFLADNIWETAGLLLLGTGLLRLFYVPNVSSSNYLDNHVFIAKLCIIGAILLLELVPMLTLIRWRFAVAQDEPVRFSSATLIAQISFMQTLLMVLVVLSATATAHGFGDYSTGK
jgi:putative membrane protein